MKKKLLYLFVLLNCVQYTFAQYCESVEMTQKYLNYNVDLAKEYEKQKEYTNNEIIQDVNYTIPVVFHVIYNTNTENVSQSVIQQMLNTINNDFSQTNIEFNNPPRPDFLGVAADTQIEFCLATVDPNGNVLPEPGITRTQTDVTSFDMQATTSIGIPEEAMKFNSKGGKDAFNSSKYLNIWVCDLLQATPFGGVAGYTIFPIGGVFGTVGSAYDGVVLDYQIGLQGRTITHELGHYFGLYHPWGESLSDPNCVEDDGILDTPETDEANYNCNYNTSSCSSLDMVENFMDYSTCQWMFTQGQKTKMHNIINTLRSSILTATSCGDVGVLANDINNNIVYPNPSKEKIFFNKKYINIKLFDSTGKLVLQEKNVPEFINISQFNSGVYTLQCNTVKNVETTKIIIQN